MTLTTCSHSATPADGRTTPGPAAPCDEVTGQLLRTLAAARPGGRILELGTGTGVSAGWLLEGMDADATLLSVEQDPVVAAVAAAHLGADPRLELVVGDGGELIDALAGRRFDLIFADTRPGTFHHLDRTLDLLATGGQYLVDDLLPQRNWPTDHARAVRTLIDRLTTDPRLHTTYLDCSTGLLLATRRR
ncbi:O-methyltransferase [Kitasatospora sp. NPDC059795]|uniref:O-methyltransferase n=1 Tax=Kitasatospora sp. NPDC059795 TaxID=3346949 RepID=UPI0036612578